MLQLSQELLLVHHRVNAPLRYYAAFTHLFHCVQLLFLLLFYLPDLSKSSSSDHIVKLKVVLSHGYSRGQCKVNDYQ
jgi:hypothetical protein